MVNYLKEWSTTFSLEQREVIRQILFQAIEEYKLELVSWVILPRSYRIVIRSKQVFINGFLDPQAPMIHFAKKFQQRLSAMKNDGAHYTWTERYRSTDIDKADLLATMASIDTAAEWTGISSSVDEYFFSSYYHAKFCNDLNAQEWIKKITKVKTSWPEANKAYRKAMTTITSSL
jgi:hypothetical protein